ncbi:hypothetical protein M407DRAFT_22018 [Tulasnella calospora MUT 4182]|uniref:ABC transporter domain-containing protein n=1 Tax=Tulasnella calospora MUT 4182 TaxID=1051891 RepID=A0A0C3M512_9AGAM|nr:hypothetical protein M407DRAFT_22018 [Tulasnella calospora MUT 4182]
MFSLLSLTWAISNSASSTAKPVPTKGAEGPPTSDLRKLKFPSSIYLYKKGIYTVWEHVPVWTHSIPGSSIWRDLETFRASSPYIGIMLRDVWSLGPFLCTTYMVATVLQNILPAMKLAQTARLLSLLENAMITKNVDKGAIYIAIVLQVIMKIAQRAGSSSQPILKQRFKHHYNQKLIALQLKMDLPTEVQAKIRAAGADGGNRAWTAFNTLIKILGTILQLTSTSGYVMGSMSQQPGGNTIAVLCLLSAFFTSFEIRQWLVVFYADVTNKSYKRMKTLYNFATDSQRKLEALANVTGDYVEKEYADARKDLGDTPDDYPWGGDTPAFSLFNLARDLLGDSGLLLLAIKMIASPGAIPLASIAVMEQTTQVLDYAIQSLMGEGPTIGENFMRVKALYEVDHIVNKIQDGAESYPPEENKGKAMKVEFRNVFFKYPKSDSKDNVIDGLSFVIPAGSICVIVGENGCGKGSTLKLLTRTYDITDGKIFIDDKPIESYKLNLLRDASAIMHQDYLHFKFSIRENIGFSNVALMNDLDAIKEAAKLGGADEFIEKLPSGYDTIMGEEPKSVSSGSPPDGSALDLMLKEKKEAPQAFSGGQTQRMALSRTFMRSMGDRVKLLAYDEPSAALDPKAEFALFERLRGLKGDKTMLFITHRFGYLTKYADQIIYMEKGKAVEKGSHDELLAMNGRYAHMYNVQAKAFI